MKNLLQLLLLLTLHSGACGQNNGKLLSFSTIAPDSIFYYPIDTTGYLDYHRFVYQAERYFLDGEDARSLEVYRKVFDAYSFIFAKDAAIAAQVAAKTGALDLFLHFTEKAFRSGVMLDCLMDIPVFAQFVGGQRLKDTLEVMNEVGRKAYMASINLEQKQRYIQRYREEQAFKKAKAFESYEQAVLANVAAIRQDIEAGGFPAGRIIGIDGPFLSPERDHCQLSSEVTLISLYHYPCSYSELRELLFEEMRKGNLHPKDVAFIYEYEKELSKNGHNRFENRCQPMDKESTPLYIDWEEPVDPRTFPAANALRRAFFLPPVEHSLRKKAYAEKHGTRLFFGFGIGFFGGHR